MGADGGGADDGAGDGARRGRHDTVTVRAPGLVLTEHEIAVPLDHDHPDGQQLTIFAREVADPGGLDRPFLLYLEGGPGHEAPRPTRGPTDPPWLDRALRDFRVLFLDQRGTGRSSPVGVPDGSPQQQADHLALFRADSIVKDAEVLRDRLGVDRWSLLGQSFGGFCSLHYLSVAPEAVREAMFTGGLPPVARSVDDVYAATYATMRERNVRHHARHRGDRDRLRRLVELCDAGEVLLPGGTAMTARRVRSLGHLLGMSDGSEHLHHLLERDPSSPAFRHDLAAATPFGGRNPLYAAIHEACYADGQATRWSAERVLPEDFRDDPTLLTGEHVFRWSFDDDPELAPLREAADLLAEREWPALYDADVLASCGVPCAAAVYADDAYVDRVFSEETAAMVPTLRTWVTNEYEHNGLGVGADAVLDRLLGMARGSVP